jgi:predicted porin
MKFSVKRLHAAIIVALSASAVAYAPAALAQDADNTKQEIEALKQQVGELMKKIDQLSSKQEATSAKQEDLEKKASSVSSSVMNFIKSTQFYGNLDLSIDDTTKGLQSSYAQGGSPVGKVGWMPAISTNLSYIGLRGNHALGDNLNVVFQLETQLDIAATAGTSNTNSNNDTTVKGALTSRNSFLGLAGPNWGALKIGKTDAPYKNSTARMNPFSGMLGDYSVVMGNSGGDNRVEFGTRLDHAIWYESPNMGGFTVNVLASPGQNRSDDNSLIASGESSCAGGNAPGSGALPPSCNDGSFGSAYSASVSFTQGPLYVTAAYELHQDVNRTSDLANLDPRDVGDETAAKVGVQYVFPTQTTVSAIYERMKRKISADLEFQNERSRSGYWLALTQALSAKDELSFGWAHANATPGDPGQHNTPGGDNPDNAANMYTLAYKHKLDAQTTWYADVAMTDNHSAAHYDLGAGGRAVTTDCHDASQLAAFDATTGAVTGNGPHCFAGGKLKGVSLGVNYKF